MGEKGAENENGCAFSAHVAALGAVWRGANGIRRITLRARLLLGVYQTDCYLIIRNTIACDRNAFVSKQI
jgi:hypothetical protein